MRQRLVAWIRGVFGGDSDTDEDEADGSVWDFIPTSQYTGVHAESGGIARAEQERALQEIDQKAEIIENGMPDQQEHDPHRR